MVNRFAGRCVRCGTTVAPAAGDAIKQPDGRWAVAHATCPTPVVLDADDASYEAWLERPVEAGMYRLPDGDIVKVQRAVHGSGNLYAKRLVIPPFAADGPAAGTFVYEAGLIRHLNPDMRLTLDQATAFGKVYGMCCVCAATLTDERSIAAGIGPVCGGRL